MKKVVMFIITIMLFISCDNSTNVVDDVDIIISPHNIKTPDEDRLSFSITTSTDINLIYVVISNPIGQSNIYKFDGDKVSTHTPYPLQKKNHYHIKHQGEWKFILQGKIYNEEELFYKEYSLKIEL